MKFEPIKGQEKLLSVVSLGISLIFAGLICMRIISYNKLSSKADKVESTIQTIIAEDCNNPGDLEKYLGKTKEIASDLKKSNLFAPPPPKTNPVTQVTGILGNEAFINNKWYKEGDKIQDANIVSIEPTQVTVEWNGQTTVLRPLGANIASDEPSEAVPPRPENAIPSESRTVSTVRPVPEQPPEEISQPEIVMMEQPSQAQIPEEIKNVLRQANIQNLSPEMLQNMSDEQKAEIQKMIRMQMERD